VLSRNGIVRTRDRIVSVYNGIAWKDNGIAWKDNGIVLGRNGIVGSAIEILSGGNGMGGRAIVLSRATAPLAHRF
jgi:hypothetical protein